jgi:hypothetical protein
MDAGFAVHDGNRGGLAGEGRLPGTAGVPAIQLDHLQGNVTLLAGILQSVTPQPVGVRIAGASDANILLMGNLLMGTDAVVNNASGARAGMINNRMATPTGLLPDPAPVDATFLRRMLAYARSEKPRTLTALRPGITDLRINRVFTHDCINGMELRAK